MGVKIESDIEAYPEFWLEFRDKNWRFKDRRRIMETNSDWEGLQIILEYVEDWYLEDVSGRPIEFDAEAGVEQLDDVDDILIIPWIARAYWMARAELSILPKQS